MRYRILITDEIDPEGVALLAGEEAFDVDEVPTLPPDELMARIPAYDALVGRSATKVSADLLRAGTRLKVVGRAGVGVDNIALDTATELGIAIINAPAGNTVAVAELFFGVLISLLRHLPRAYESTHAGRWERSSLLGAELKGRTLGIVGLGRIGGEVAARAHTFDMPLVAYDPYITESRFQSLRAHRAASLDELLDEADIVTVHTPLTDETRGMIGKRELARLSPSAIVVNMARGGIVDEDALAEALAAGKLTAAAVDAFTREPLRSDHPLVKLPNAFLTPHIGASTAEAQRNVAVDACAAVRDALLAGEYSRSINVPEGEHGKWEELRPARLLTRRAAAIGRAILAAQGTSVVGRIDVRGSHALSPARETLVASAALGVLDAVLEQERLNLINARTLAEARGIELSFTEALDGGQPDAASATRAVEVRLTGGMNDITVGGIAYGHAGDENGDGAFRITRIGAFRVDVYPRDTLVILTNRDVPGVIGRVGTLLGEAGVNIAEYHQARLAQGGEALAAVSVDGGVGEDVKRRLLELPRRAIGDGGELQEKVSAQIETDPDIRAMFAADASGLRYLPDGVTRPESVQEVTEILRRAASARTPVTPAGMQTSTTGASITEGGVLLSMRGLSSVSGVDREARTIRAGAGAILGEVKRTAAAEGLLFAPDPTSEDESSVGGAIACNASGARTFKYGATREHVRAVTVVLASGEVVQYSRMGLEKNTAGYAFAHDPVDWFVGSEGTLGVVVEAELELLPLPERVIGLEIPFANEQEALEFVVSARESRTVAPRCLEYFDQLAVGIARGAESSRGFSDHGIALVPAAGTMVYVEEEVSNEGVGDKGRSDYDSVLDAWLALAESQRARVDEVRVFDGEQALAAARRIRHAVPATMNERGAGHRTAGGRKVSTDWAVPYRRLNEAIAASREMARRAGVAQAVTYGHAGNGHPHQNYIARDAEELEAIERVVEQTLRMVVEMGGTVSAEHGIGKLKTHWLPLQMSPLAFRVMRAVKQELDPLGILAPGNIF